MKPNGRTFDVIVLGGGPAGATAATVLARLGVRPVLLDVRRAGKRRKGEILDSRALGLLGKLGLDGRLLGLASATVPGHVLDWNTGPDEVSNVRNPFGQGRVVDRDQLDPLLREAASLAGAVVTETETPPEAEYTENRWFARAGCKVGGTAFSAPLLLDCTGRRASVVRRFGRRLRLDRLVCDYYLATTATADLDSRWLVAADELGWWYSVRTGSRLRVFCRFHAEPGRRIGRRLEFLRRDCHVALTAERFACEVSEAARLDASSWMFDFEHPSLAAAGDAAFTIDPLSGQGVSLAVAQGVLAADAAARHLGGARTALAQLKAIQRREFQSAAVSRLETYSACDRWKDSPFWKNRLRPTRDAASHSSP